LDLANKKTNEIANEILSFATTINQTQKWRNITMEEIYGKLDDGQKVHILDYAIEASKAMLQLSTVENFNNGKRVQPENLKQLYYISVSDKAIPLFNENGDFYQKVASTAGEIKPQYISTGLHDQIFFYRIDGIVPPLAITAIKELEEEYDRDSIDYQPHFDQIIFDTMKEEGHSLHAESNLKDTKMYWVLGLITDLFIKKTNVGFYYYYNPESKSTEGFGTKMDKLGNTKERHNAFKVFQREFPKLKPVYSKMLQEYINKDTVAFRRLIEDVITIVKDGDLESSNYLAKNDGTENRPKFRYSKSEYKPRSIFIDSLTSNNALSNQLKEEDKYIKEELWEEFFKESRPEDLRIDLKNSSETEMDGQNEKGKAKDIDTKKTVICPKCESINSIGQKFCGNCAASLVTNNTKRNKKPSKK
jgi:hypothetical protein